MYGNGRKNLSWAWKKSFFARKAVEVTENKSLLRGPKGYGACAELWKSPLTRVSGFLFPSLSGLDGGQNAPSEQISQSDHSTSVHSI